MSTTGNTSRTFSFVCVLCLRGIIHTTHSTLYVFNVYDVVHVLLVRPNTCTVSTTMYVYLIFNLVLSTRPGFVNFKKINAISICTFYSQLQKCWHTTTSRHTFSCCIRGLLRWPNSKIKRHLSQHVQIRRSLKRKPVSSSYAPVLTSDKNVTETLLLVTF